MAQRYGRTGLRRRSGSRQSWLGEVPSPLAIGRNDRAGLASSAAAAKRRRSSPVALEALEERSLLSTIVVNSTMSKLFQAPTATDTTERGPLIQPARRH
jgi:hypothetical protein